MRLHTKMRVQVVVQTKLETISLVHLDTGSVFVSHIHSLVTVGNDTGATVAGAVFDSSKR